ncbi:MAG: CPBP family intramembrane metalloprotease [Parachlamydiaceae bacterium]|nr:CPBP family intramembrane metalloprotease [Parachlamydiaceae bacterium]
MSQKKILIALWISCIIGSLAIIPYIRYLNVIDTSSSITNLLLLTAIQASIFYGIILWLVSLILPRTNLLPFITTDPINRILFPGILAGTLVGLTIFILNKTIFYNSTLSTFHTPFWVGILASIYGAINEEVLLRLFLFTFIYFIICKIFKKSDQNSIRLWTSNALVALMFGLGHLPAAFRIAQPSSYEISRILILNGIASIAFGWLYWSKGLWTAILAHFIADLVLHVFLK